MTNTSRYRVTNSINASSMADIAFLLLIFFLVTTTILNDKGIMVQLPPYEENTAITPVNEENILTVLINKNNELMVEGSALPLDALRDRVKTFIINPLQLENLPNSPEKAIIFLKNDRGTTYESYLGVYNELKAAYVELWDEVALDRYGKLFQELPLTYQKRIRSDIPLVISEAEPTDYTSEQQ